MVVWPLSYWSISITFRNLAHGIFLGYRFHNWCVCYLKTQNTVIFNAYFISVFQCYWNTAANPEYICSFLILFFPERNISVILHLLLFDFQVKMFMRHANVWVLRVLKSIPLRHYTSKDYSFNFPFGSSGPVESDLAYGRRVGRRWSLRSFATHHILWFY